MHRVPFLIALLAMLTTAVPGASVARPRGDEFEQRRAELRQQLADERQRWRQEQGRQPGMPPGYQQPAPWQHPPGGPGPGRLSPEERRELRQELRRHGGFGPGGRDR